MKEENELEKEINLYENPVYRIAEELRKEGYEIAGHMGVKQKKPTQNMVGILQERESIKKSFLGIKYNQPQRAFHLGTIWINHSEKGAIEDKNWVLEVNGKNYESKLTELVERLSLPYNVKVEVRLNSNVPKRENYLSDLGN